MREFKRKRGFLTFAQNGAHDYVRLAYALALSLKASQQSTSDLSIAITPGTYIDERYRWAFDEVIDIPWGDGAIKSSWKLENEWKMYHITPYEETMKLDADMLFSHDIGEWWNYRKHEAMMLSSRATTFRDTPISYGRYRECLQRAAMPDCYSALMRFRWSDDVEVFFEHFENVTYDWQSYYERFFEPQHRPEYFSTDIALSIALVLSGHAETWGAPGDAWGPRFIHMRSDLQQYDIQRPSKDWTDHTQLTLTNALELKLGRFRVTTPLHYINKDIITDAIIERYEKAVKV